MGPKKKAGKASKGGRGLGGIIDGVPMAEMPREHLEKYTMRIKDELEREREERNFFQLERDKLRTFWEITRQQLEESKAELRNKDRALEEAEEKHQTELKEFNEKVKHLMYEHQNHLTEVKAENMVALRQAQEEFQKQEAILIEENEALNKQKIDEQLSHEEKIREIYKNHSEEIFAVREEFLEKIQEMGIRAEKRQGATREYYETKNRTELAEVEEKKNSIIEKLKSCQKEALLEMKSYYSDIVKNNLALIAALKDDLAELKQENEEADSKVKKLADENGKLIKPLKEARKRVNELEKVAQINKKDKTSLMDIHARYKESKQKLEDVSLERDSLKLQIERLQFEIDELKAKYSSAFGEIQKKNCLKTKVLEDRITFLEEEGELKEILLAQTIRKSNVDSKYNLEANKQIREMISRKAKILDLLKLELGKAVRQHDQMLEDFKNQATAGKISFDTIHYQALRPKLQHVIKEYSSHHSSYENLVDKIQPLDL